MEHGYVWMYESPLHKIAMAAIICLSEVPALPDAWKTHGSLNISGGHLPSGPLAGEPFG